MKIIAARAALVILIVSSSILAVYAPKRLTISALEEVVARSDYIFEGVVISSHMNRDSASRRHHAPPNTPFKVRISVKYSVGEVLKGGEIRGTVLIGHVQPLPCVEQKINTFKSLPCTNFPIGKKFFILASIFEFVGKRSLSGVEVLPNSPYLKSEMLQIVKDQAGWRSWRIWEIAGLRGSISTAVWEDDAIVSPYSISKIESEIRRADVIFEGVVVSSRVSNESPALRAASIKARKYYVNKALVVEYRPIKILKGERPNRSILLLHRQIEHCRGLGPIWDFAWCNKFYPGKKFLLMAKWTSKDASLEYHGLSSKALFPITPKARKKFNELVSKNIGWRGWWIWHIWDWIDFKFYGFDGHRD